MGNDDVRLYYDSEPEKERDRLLKAGKNSLEFLRVQDLLRRHLPAAPAVVLDVGGGAGIHAFPLAKAGYEVHLVDLTPSLVEMAKEAVTPLKSCSVGDARDLDFPDGFADVVLLFGPMYHLVDAEDRSEVLREAYRVLKPGGCLFVTAISRFASFLDGVNKQFLEDPVLGEIIKKDLATGVHINPSDEIAYFTTAYFYLPKDLSEAVRSAGFKDVNLKCIQGPLYNNEKVAYFLEEPERQKALMDFLEMIESEESIMGTSVHFMALGRK